MRRPGASQLTKEYQSHSGAVDTATSPALEYACTDGSANHARRTSVQYPDGTALGYNYGSSGTANNALNRVQALTQGGVTLANYSYQGEVRPDGRRLRMGGKSHVSNLIYRQTRNRKKWKK